MSICSSRDKVHFTFTFVPQILPPALSQGIGVLAFYDTSLIDDLLLFFSFISETIFQLKKKHEFDYGFVNCMSIRTPADIYRLVLDSLAGDDEKVETVRSRLSPVEQLAETVRQRFVGSERSTYVSFQLKYCLSDG